MPKPNPNRGVWILLGSVLALCGIPFVLAGIVGVCMLGVLASRPVPARVPAPVIVQQPQPAAVAPFVAAKQVEAAQPVAPVAEPTGIEPIPGVNFGAATLKPIDTKQHDLGPPVVGATTQPGSGVGAAKTVHVNGYVTKSGTVVAPHMRAAPRK